MAPLLRFAPSPTGLLHLGGLRTALFNHLYARKLGGKWILRIEDTDQSRTIPDSVEGIQDALAWAGLEYDFGPARPGPHGPYYQSERLDLYGTVADRLLESGHAYRCFCSPDRLQETREKLARAGSNSTYDKHCLNLTEEDVARRVRAGERSIVRLNDGRLPQRDTPQDLIFGTLRDAHESLPTDPVLLKSDRHPTYHLASVADDHEMGITHVLRGEEWLASLPLHLDLYACLNLTPPKFAHFPILLNRDGTKMSKRKGDVHVQEFMKRGWEPAAIINWLGLAGWGGSRNALDPLESPPDSTAIMTLSDMITKFEFSHVTHRRSILDPIKLEYLNKHHVARQAATDDGLEVLVDRLEVIVRKMYPDSLGRDDEYLKRCVQVTHSRVATLNDVPIFAPYFFVEPDYGSAEATTFIKSIPAEIYNTVVDAVIEDFDTKLQWDVGTLLTQLHATQPRTEANQKQFMVILRHALSARKAGPGVAEIMFVLGPTVTNQRLHNASRYISDVQIIKT